MRVMILYLKQGHGHFKVAESIQEQLLKDNIEVMLLNPMEMSNKILSGIWEKIYGFFQKTFPWIKKWYYYKYLPKSNFNKLSFFEMILCKIYSSNKFITIIDNFKPNIIITCNASINSLVSYMKKKQIIKIKTINIITDYALYNGNIKLNSYVDAYLVPNKTIMNDMVEKGINKNKVFITGIPIQDKFNRIFFNKRKIQKRMGLDPKIPVILFLCGGGLGISSSFNSFKTLVKKFKDYQYVFVSGSNRILSKRALYFINSIDCKCIIYGYANNIPELLSVVTIVVTKPGGITITECIKMRKKMILIDPIPGQEEANAKYIEKIGYGKLVQNDDELIIEIPKLISDKVSKLKKEKTIKITKILKEVMEK